MKMTRRRLLLLLLCLAALAALLVSLKVFQRPTSLDGDRIALAETRMWRAYYARDYHALGFELVVLLHSQFKLSLWEAGFIARDLAEASAIFQPSSRNYERALPALIRAYSHIKKETDGTWNPEEAAKAELDWWTARRTPGRDSVEQVGKSITHLYVVLYGKSNEDIEQAGYFRAQAAALRDSSGGAAGDWPRIESLLKESYRHLVRGITY